MQQTDKDAAIALLRKWDIEDEQAAALLEITVRYGETPIGEIAVLILKQARRVEALEAHISRADPCRWATLQDIETAKEWEREALVLLSDSETPKGEG